MNDRELRLKVVEYIPHLRRESMRFEGLFQEFRIRRQNALVAMALSV